MKKGDKWTKKWEVEGSNGNAWVVAQDREGNWGCSCPVWKFRRRECHHILRVKNGGGGNPKTIELKPKPTYRLGMITKPYYKEETNELFIPLVDIGDIKMEATICYTLLEYGYSMGEIREIRHLPRSWTTKAIISYVKAYGKAEYPAEDRRVI